MMSNNMAMDNITQDSASRPRPDIPRNSGPKTEDEVDERDITDYTLPQWQWSRSTDELLAPCIPSSPRSSFYSVVTTIPDDDIQQNPEACAGQFSRLPVPPIRVQLADQQSNGMEAEARTIYNPNPYPCQSGLRLEMSGDDLELQDITVPYPASRTQSTDQLVSNDNPAQLDESSTANPKFPDEQPPAERTCPAKTTGQTPDWKPLSIRWPFQMLLLVIMAGLVAFFEYQAHDLPPVQYTMIQLKPPAEGQRLEQGAVNATTTLSSAQVPLQTPPSPGVRGASLPTSTSSSDSPSFAKPNIMVAAPAPAPTPEPDPRPPEDAYPRPPILFSTRCGYKKPEWLVFQESFVRNPQMILKQVIPTFFTDDETWCPCYVELKAWTNTTELTWSGDWGNMIYVKRTTSTRTEFSVTRAVAFDKECQTIMSLVFQHNNNYVNDFLDGRAGSCYHRHGDGHVMTITPGSVSLPGGTAIAPSLFSTSTMTLSEQPIGVADWEWPKTDTQGNVQFLVDLRDVSSSLLRSRATNECVFQTLDAFGNKFDVPPYTGFWFASHATTTGPNTLRRDWWTLPLSYASAVSSAEISTESKKVESSTAQVKDSTTLRLSTEAPTSVVSTSSAPNTLSSLMEMSSLVTTQDHSKISETMASATNTISTSSSTSTTESLVRTASSTASHDQLNNSMSIPETSLIAVPQSPSPDTALTNIPGKTLSGGQSSSSSPAMRSTTQVGIIASTRLSSTAVLASTGQSATLRTTVISASPKQEEQPMTSGILHVVNGTSSSERTREANPNRTINTPDEHTDKSFVARPTIESSNATKPPIASMTIHHSPNITAALRPTPERGASNSLSRAKIKSAQQFTLLGSNTNTSTESSPMRVMPGTQLETRKYSDPSSPSHSHAIADPILANATTSTTADTPKLTEMPKGPIAPGKGSSFANLRSDADFFMASLAPVILATVLSIAIQVFTSSVSSMLPFRALGNSISDGARAEDTLTLSRNTGLWGLAGFRLLSRYRDVLSLINVLLGLLAAALVPVSSEVIRLEFSQYCGTSTERKNFADVPEVLPGHNMVCAYGLRKSGPTMRLAEGIVAVMALMLCGMGYIIFCWRTGVGTEPWSIASMAALLVSSDYRIGDALLSIDAPPLPDTSRGVNNGQTGAEIKQAFQGKRFRIGWFSPQPEVIRQTTTATTTTNYGIYMVNEPVLQDRSSIRVTTRDPPPPPKSRTKCQTSRGNISQRRWWRHIIVPPQHKENVLLSIALFLTMALLVLILYYENTISPDTKFEMFMNSQTFGVRILFTSLGTAATWFWDYYFSYTSSRAVYTRLFKQADGKPEGEPARSSILLSPPTNVFLGIYQSAILLITATTTTTSDNKKRRLGMIVHGLSIALVALLAKFTPILFANIPFRDTVTFRMHEVCTWLAVFVLGCMVLVLCVSIWVNVMHEKITLPVMPDTIIGGMYYLAGAGMLRD
ncbi:hypothetical protein V8F06_012754 [Rhypophila decipiens]